MFYTNKIDISIVVVATADVVAVDDDLSFIHNQSHTHTQRHFE